MACLSKINARDICKAQYQLGIIKTGAHVKGSPVKAIKDLPFSMFMISY